jgi:hypothetical protein
MRIEIEREKDGRWIAEITELPGVMVYGDTCSQAISKAEALALQAAPTRPLDPDVTCLAGPSALQAFCPRSATP